MRVQLDELWTTPSTLHARVTVWGPDNAWSHRYYPSMALADIPEEALSGLLARAADTDTDSRYEDLSLF